MRDRGGQLIDGIDGRAMVDGGGVTRGIGVVCNGRCPSVFRADLQRRFVGQGIGMLGASRGLVDHDLGRRGG